MINDHAPADNGRLDVDDDHPRGRHAPQVVPTIPLRRAASGPDLPFADLPTRGGRDAVLRGLFERLAAVIDPEIGYNIVDLGLVYEVLKPQRWSRARAMTLTSMGCPLTEIIHQQCSVILGAMPGVDQRRRRVHLHSAVVDRHDGRLRPRRASGHGHERLSRGDRVGSDGHRPTTIRGRGVSTSGLQSVTYAPVNPRPAARAPAAASAISRATPAGTWPMAPLSGLLRADSAGSAGWDKRQRLLSPRCARRRRPDPGHRRCTSSPGRSAPRAVPSRAAASRGCALRSPRPDAPARCPSR
jgi:metal-sulfur cluster biosynthetic enzyme